jgi:hypothetical protein
VPLKRSNARVTLALAVIATAMPLIGCGTTDRDDLRTDAEQVHSLAAEGMLLAEQASHRRLPVEFVWLHAQELRHSAVQVRDRLDGEIIPATVAPYVPEVKQRLDAVVAALHLLHAEPNSPRAARSAETTLARESRASEQLADRLS